MVDLKTLPIEISETNEVRSLHLETDSIQSSMLIHDPIHLALKYTQVVALTLLFCRHPKNITILGLGAGSLTKFFFYLCPRTKINTIEINPRVIDIAHQMFEVPFETKRHHIIESDAEIYLKQNKSKLQILISDIFDGYGIPRTFTQKKYFKLCSERLENNGLFIINLWGSDKKTPNYIQDLKLIFSRVIIVESDNPGNVIIFCFKHKFLFPSKRQMDVRLSFLENKINFDLPFFYKRMLKRNKQLFESMNCL